MMNSSKSRLESSFTGAKLPTFFFQVAIVRFLNSRLKKKKIYSEFIKTLGILDILQISGSKIGTTCIKGNLVILIPLFVCIIHVKYL